MKEFSAQIEVPIPGEEQHAIAEIFESETEADCLHWVVSVIRPGQIGTVNRLLHGTIHWAECHEETGFDGSITWPITWKKRRPIGGSVPLPRTHPLEMLKRQVQTAASSLKTDADRPKYPPLTIQYVEGQEAAYGRVLKWIAELEDM